MSPSAKDPLGHLATLVSSDEFFTPDSPLYADESKTWSAARNEHPAVVIRPKTIEKLSSVVQYLSTNTDLNYKVRSRGYGSASARDVVLSMTAFDDFEWDADRQIVTLGAGANWRKYYEEMEKVAPKQMIVAGRTPSIGVGGSTLCSGFSWLSHEYGCVSDASNLLDAQVVLADGTITWASEHPELSWAMRGTEGGFAIAVRFKFAAKSFTENGNIWGGPILLPRDKVRETAKGIATMCAREDVHPKVGLFVYVLKKEFLELLSGGDQDMLVVHAYDALGEEHGRKEFAWALAVEGAIDRTKSGMTMREMCALQDNLGNFQGLSSCYWTPMALAKVTKDHVIRSFEWWADVGSSPHGSVADNAYLLFELFSCRDNLTSRASSAWPRPEGFKHMLLIGAGCRADADKGELAEARRLVEEVAPSKILGGEEEAKKMVPIPNATEEFHNVEYVYGEHWAKLRQVKKRYDPENRLKGWIPPA